MRGVVRWVGIVKPLRYARLIGGCHTTPKQHRIVNTTTTVHSKGASSTGTCVWYTVMRTCAGAVACVLTSAAITRRHSSFSAADSVDDARALRHACGRVAVDFTATGATSMSSQSSESSSGRASDTHVSKGSANGSAAAGVPACAVAAAGAAVAATVTIYQRQAVHHATPGVRPETASHS